MRLNAETLLDALAAGTPLSGSALASRFGVTRAAIWKQVAQLRALGLAIEARAGEGYRLAVPFERLDAARIRAAMPAAARARLGSLDVAWQLDSTNSALLRRAGDDPRSGLACLAEIQSAGRGRRGRSWRLPLGGGIALSLLLRFDSGMAALAGLSLAAGVALMRAFDDLGIDALSIGGVGLKWPNDAQVDGRKLAGILVELGGDYLGPCHAVIGIGVNLRLGEDPGIDQPWTDLAALGAAPSRNALAGALLARLLEMHAQFVEHGFAAFAETYARYDVLRGRPLRVLGAHGGERHGVALGVDAGGRLRVAGDEGEIAVDSGEVSVRTDDVR